MGTPGIALGFLLKKDGYTQQHLHLEGRLAQQRSHFSSQDHGLGSSVVPLQLQTGMPEPINHNINVYYSTD